MTNPRTRGRVQALWVKRAHRGPMDAAQQVTLIAGGGVQGSADRGGSRQVTLISEERWDRLLEQLGERPDPSVRRANVLVRGLDLAGRRGAVLVIGKARLRIKGETRPCERMDEAVDGLRAALRIDLGGGVYGEVLTGGVVRVGDPVGWEDATAQDTSPVR
jgi:MOSC domain-containing protein YiiM